MRIDPFDYNVFSLLWGGWFLYFIIVETVALTNDRGSDTLSAHVWYQIASHPYLVGFPLIILLCWMFYHFFTEGPWGSN